MIHQQRPGRRLRQQSVKKDSAHSWEGLIDRYNAEISDSGVEGKLRRLNEKDSEGLSAMVDWFGAIYQAKGWPDEAKAQATEADIEDYCDFVPDSVNLQPPLLGGTGYMKMVLKPASGEPHPEYGDTQILYLGYTAAKENNGFKFVSHVTHSHSQFRMKVLEMSISKSWKYSFIHPQAAVLDNVPNYYPDDVMEAVKALQGTLPVDAADLLLQSEASRNDTYKDHCFISAHTDGPNETVSEESGHEIVLDPAQPVDCANEVVRYWFEGLTLEATIDGAIVGLAIGDDRFLVQGDITFPEGPLAFEGCEQYSIKHPASYDGSFYGQELRRLSEQGDSGQGYVHQAHRRLEAHGYTTNHSRRLSAFTTFQAWASNTQWCGSGTDIENTPCPGTGGGDTEADYACHRHDHGTKADGIIGGAAVRLGCDIDRGLAERTSNGAAQAVFGSWGLAQTWGCYDSGSYSCANWKSKWWGGYWRYGSYCSGEHTHYGPSRYSSYSHSYGWKSQSRCETPLSWGTGSI
jgi:hypothetical protein